MHTNGFVAFRAEADEDASPIDLAAGGGSWLSLPGGVLTLDVDPSDNYVAADILNIIVAGGCDAGTDPDGKTFSWKLWCWADEDSPAELAAYGTGVLGTQRVGRFPDGTDDASDAIRNWADTLVVTACMFPNMVSVADVGQNAIAELRVDCAKRKYWKMEFSSADGSTGDEAGALSAWLFWYQA